MDKNKPFANLFYFRRLMRIGGTEQFLYELAKKYHYLDIVVMYDDADIDQLLRLKRLVRCIKRETGHTYYAVKAFYNFNLEALPQIEAHEHIFICHAIYQKIGFAPPLTNPKLTGFIGVSDYACRELKKYGDYQGVEIAPVKVYNPLTLEKPDKIIKLISACRLDDKVKGGARTIKLIEALDKYSEQHGRHYIWHIYSNDTKFRIDSPNVALMPGRSDIRPFIADADYLVQLSDDMESYCYSINEALGYGTCIVRTPLSIAEELSIPKQADIVAEWDMSNADEVVEKIFDKNKKPFKYYPPMDGWKEMLVNSVNSYSPGKINVTVRAIRSYYDLESKEQKNTYSEPWEVDPGRARYLVRKGFVHIVG